MLQMNLFGRLPQEYLEIGRIILNDKQTKPINRSVFEHELNIIGIHCLHICWFTISITRVIVIAFEDCFYATVLSESDDGIIE